VKKAPWSQVAALEALAGYVSGLTDTKGYGNLMSLLIARSEPQMNADERRFKHEEVTRRIIRVFFDVYNDLGYGFVESVYQEAMALTLVFEGLHVERESTLEVHFRGQVIGVFRADLVVNGSILVELKALKSLAPIHEAQTLNYLRAGVLEVALLLNFGPEPQIKRLAFSNERKLRRGSSASRSASICVHLR
jgi:GxxExxY protein